MKTLVNYWRVKLRFNKWLMSHEDTVMVSETISALLELDRLRKATRVQREADIVRTVKELSSAKEVSTR